MVFRYDPEKRPTVPSELAHKANALATDASVAEQSRQTLERQIRRELEHPIHLTLQEASRGSRLILYMLLGSIAFPAFVLWEAVISREIYEVVLPYPSMWWVPIIGCMGFGLWASAAFGEFFTDFRLLNHNPEAAEREEAIDRARGDLYGVSRKRMPLSVGFHPATGAFIAIGLLAVIWWFSGRRVELRKEFGGDPGLFQVYLPVILYVGEIALGMPALFVMAYCYTTVRLKRLRAHLVQAKSSEDTLRQAAIQSYTQHLQQFANYNGNVDQHLPRVFLVPANENLRRLLREEGYDLTQGTSQRDSSGPEGTTMPVNGNGGLGTPHDGPVSTPGEDQGRGTTTTQTPTQQVPSEGSREDDLTRLLDELITSQNGRF